MEELQKQVSEILKHSSANDKAAEELNAALEVCGELKSEAVANLVLNAYRQGMNVFFDGYLKYEKEAEKLRKQIDKVKEHLFADYIKDNEVKQEIPF